MENKLSIVSDFLGDIVSATLGDAGAATKVSLNFATMPFALKEMIFWGKFERFLLGTFKDEDDRLKMAAKFAETGNRDENAYRLVQCIDRVDSMQKVDYLVNATRSVLAGYIDLPMYFRICQAVTNALLEDLHFLRDNIRKVNGGRTTFESKKFLTYSFSVQGLQLVGLTDMNYVSQDGILQYGFTDLAEYVDRFSVSFGDVNRYPEPIYAMPLDDKAQHRLNIEPPPAVFG